MKEFKNKVAVITGLIPRVVGPRYQDIGAPFARAGLKVAERLGFEL